jgi:hypothetical protein
MKLDNSADHVNCGNGVRSCIGYFKDKVVLAVALFKTAIAKIEPKSNVKDAGRSCLTADDYGPQRFCAECEAKLEPVYGNMDAVPCWEHTHIDITQETEEEWDETTEQYIEVTHEVRSCEYQVGEIVKDEDVVSHTGFTKQIDVSVNFKLFWKMKKTHKLWKSAHELVTLANKFKETRRVKNITVPMAESYLSSLTKLDKKNANWFVKNKDAIKAIYELHADDVGEMPTDVEDATTMSVNQL